MRFLHPNGKYYSRNIEKYRIKWDKPSLSKIQFKVKQFLMPYWKFHICYEEAPLIGTLLQCDLLNLTKKIAIEVHGKQHGEFNKFFHANSRNKFLKGIKNDMFKREYLMHNGFELIEILEGEEKLLTKSWFENK